MDLLCETDNFYKKVIVIPYSKYSFLSQKIKRIKMMIRTVKIGKTFPIISKLCMRKLIANNNLKIESIEIINFHSKIIKT